MPTIPEEPDEEYSEEFLKALQEAVDEFHNDVVEELIDLIDGGTNVNDIDWETFSPTERRDRSARRSQRRRD